MTRMSVNIHGPFTVYTAKVPEGWSWGEVFTSEKEDHVAIVVRKTQFICSVTDCGSTEEALAAAITAIDFIQGAMP